MHGTIGKKAPHPQDPQPQAMQQLHGSQQKPTVLDDWLLKRMSDPSRGADSAMRGLFSPASK